MARPAFKPSQSQRYRVSVLAAARMPKIDIASALGIDPKTLDKHFADELSTGIAKRNSEVLMATFRAAKGGNVAAVKVWLARQEPMPPMVAGAEPPLGKKAQAERDAAIAHEGNEWGELVKH